MIKFILKVTDKKDGKCKVGFESPKKEDFEKAKDTEKSCAIVVQQKILKALEDLENE